MPVTWSTRPAAPRFLLGATVLAWGGLSGRPLVGLGLGVLIEVLRARGGRREFDDRDCERVADLTSIGFAFLVIWQWFALRDSGEGILLALSWLPVILAPPMLMQALGAPGTFPLSALVWSARRSRDDPRINRRLVLDYPYFCHCLVGAACAGAGTSWFFPTLAVLVAWALWPARRAASDGSGWLLALLAALSLAYGLHALLQVAQRETEARVVAFLRDYWDVRNGGESTRTSIGDIGELKLSDRILVRVRGDFRGPLRLRNAAYVSFHGDTWSAHGDAFRPARVSTGGEWVLNEGRVVGGGVEIALWLEGGRGVLPLPQGTVRLEGLNVAEVEVNDQATVRAAQAPSLVRFTANGAPEGFAGRGPDAKDLEVPAGLRPALDRLVIRARARGLSPAEAAETVRAFLQGNFSYTTKLTDDAGRVRSVDRFLEADEAGHCEYFATAATLALRRLGIPARYVTGYVVDEFSPLEGAYVVRARHAHAWALAWVDGHWAEIDATPAGWRIEDAGAVGRHPVGDLLSWMHYRFTEWRLRGPSAQATSAWWLATIVPLIAWIAWSVGRRSRRVPGPDPRPLPQADGADGGLGILLRAFEATGYRRPPSMPVRPWIASLPFRDGELARRVMSYARDHARHRFDPEAREESAGNLAGEAQALAALLPGALESPDR